MAHLVHLARGTIHPVPAQCLIGRAPTCALTTDERFASWEHARLQWTGHAWEIRDLGSRNGTFIDGRRVLPGEGEPVLRGSALGFGSPDAVWVLEEAGPPGASAVDLETHRVVAATGEVLALPDAERPSLSIYPARSGAGWVAEDDEGEVRAIAHQAVVNTSGRSFRVELPVVPDATPMADVAMTLENVALRFEVSKDEERAEIVVLHHGVAHRLKAREHAYVLLTMARERLRDAALPPQERGWRSISQLAEMLRISPSTVNVAIHRARQQLAAIGLEGAAGVVEVGRGKRRLGTERFSVGVLSEEG